MSQCEDREEGVPPSKSTLCGEHDSQTKAQSPEQQQGPDSAGPGPEPSCVSFKSDTSKGGLIDFKGLHVSDRQVHKESSEVPSGQSALQHQTHLDSIFMLLEENIVTFVRNELKKFRDVLSSDFPECLEIEREDGQVLDREEKEEKNTRSSREAILKITLHFLRRMKQEELAEHLQSSKRVSLKI